MKVIFNADDFGLSKGVNLGILEAYQNGVVRSTTMMAQMPGFDHACRLHREHPGLAIGLHLTLTAGRPVGNGYRTLTDPGGRFHSLAVLTQKAEAGELDPAEIEREYEAQLQKVQAAGITVDHFDSHHHTHMLAGIREVFTRLARQYDKPVRQFAASSGDPAPLQTTAAFSADFYNEGATLSRLQEIIAAAAGDSLEIMCHPAYLDAGLYHASSYNLQRILELEILTSPELKEFLDQHHLTVSSYTDL